ncbi:hypothetical protein JB92DRAFT_494046 [Gautieria morchelliformis]|nr:hypothetical protein JB92DRAFT_494046 [Gautieria morchelliformis]
MSTTAPLISRLHAAASHISQHCDRVEAEATEYLTAFRKPSPPSTLLLTPSNESIPTDDVQRAVALRIIRFVSPRPWGAPGSEASRRSSSLRLISSKLWSSNSESQQTFCAGSEVIWRPVFLRADGHMRMDHDGNTPWCRQGWLASRQPPIKRTQVLSPCVRDISALLAQETEAELLWDNRYVLALRPRLLPTKILYSCRSGGSVMIIPHGRWLLPKIVWRHAKQKDIVLGGVGLDVRDMPTGCLSSAWVNFRWIRSLEAI